MNLETKWRCGKCGTVFKAPQLAACPQCGLDPAKNPRYRAAFVPLALIHFDPPSELPGLGLNVRACQPQSPGLAGHMASGVASAVTCDACRATEVWQQQYAMEGEPGWVEGQDETIKPLGG